MPIQYNFEGEVTRWVDKSYASILWISAIQAFLVLTMWVANVSIAMAKQQVDPSRQEASMQQNRIFRRSWSAYIIVSSILLTVLFFVIGLSMMLQLSSKLIILSTFVLVGIMVFYSVILTIRLGQGGSRIRVNEEGEVVSGKLPRDEDQYWKLGQIYFNPKDPTIFLEKRFGVGWTVNFGRPIVYIGLLVLIGLPILISFLAM